MLTRVNFYSNLIVVGVLLVEKVCVGMPVFGTERKHSLNIKFCHSISHSISR